jgi:hypothetical protein
MIILNDNRFSDETFYYASNIEDIKNSPNNSTIIFKYNEQDLELYKFCKQNNISYGVEVNSLKELIFIANLNAKYAFCKLPIASILQKFVDNYLINTKIIVKSKLSNIEEIATNEIDGIFVSKGEIDEKTSYNTH